MARLATTCLFAAIALSASASATYAGTEKATYVINLGGTIIATANFTLSDEGGSYDLKLNATVTGMAQLVASGIAKADSAGTVTDSGLRSQSFGLTTRSGGEDFAVTVQYAKGSVTSFMVDPPIVNNIDRVPVERKQLNNVNDMLAAFIRRGTLDKSVCAYHTQVFTGIERFDLDFRYAKDDVATSKRTGYQGPVVLCNVKYIPISGHYTTSELTNSLAQDDRILVWYAPLGKTGYLIPYRVLLTTSMGDLSMVLTDLG